MSLKSTILHVLGTVAGILIPGASANAANMTHSIQQHFADLYGEAAADLADKLKVDTTLSGPEKIFAILKGLIDVAKNQGFKGDEKLLSAVLLDVAQAAYRKAEAIEEPALAALAVGLTGTPLAKIGVDLLLQFVQPRIDALLHLKAPAAGESPVPQAA